MSWIFLLPIRWLSWCCPYPWSSLRITVTWTTIKYFNFRIEVIIANILIQDSSHPPGFNPPYVDSWQIIQIYSRLSQMSQTHNLYFCCDIQNHFNHNNYYSRFSFTMWLDLRLNNLCHFLPITKVWIESSFFAVGCSDFYLQHFTSPEL